MVTFVIDDLRYIASNMCADDAILGLQVFTHAEQNKTYESDIARKCDLRSSDGKQSSVGSWGLV